ncbi:MAG TPA: DUF4276 family protein [Planctomycetota bacterium]|nr:DUF4276 family protein [Planctomycetota bacterium]
MSRLVLLVEEYSMKVLLDGLLPRLVPGLEFRCVPHEGKQDLEKSVPRKLRAWQEPGVRFAVVRDNDGADCRRLKTRLVGLCVEGGRADTLVRIACQELEAWYLGDPAAIADAFEAPGLRTLARKARYRDPDKVQQPAAALAELVPAFQKVSGARAMASRLSEGTASHSFGVFLRGVRNIAQAMQRNED